MYGLVGLVWQIWFGLVNEDNLKGPLVPLKVAKSSLELHLGTILVEVDWGWVGWGGSNSDYKVISVQLQLQLSAGTELGKTYQTGRYYCQILVQDLGSVCISDIFEKL